MRIEVPAEVWEAATDDEKQLMRLGCWDKIFLGEPGVIMSEPPDPETGEPRGVPVTYVWDHQGLDPVGAEVFLESLQNKALSENMSKVRGPERELDVPRLKKEMRRQRRNRFRRQGVSGVDIESLRRELKNVSRRRTGYSGGGSTPKVGPDKRKARSAGVSA